MEMADTQTISQHASAGFAIKLTLALINRLCGLVLPISPTEAATAHNKAYFTVLGDEKDGRGGTVAAGYLSVDQQGRMVFDEVRKPCVVVAQQSPHRRSSLLDWWMVRGGAPVSVGANPRNRRYSCLLRSSVMNDCIAAVSAAAAMRASWVWVYW